MIPVSVFDSYSWTEKFAGKTVVYRLCWDNKYYIGGTSRLLGRVGDWRKYAKRNMLEISIEVLLVCTPSDKEHYEAKVVELYDTFNGGHNKSPTGTNVGHRMHDNTRAAIRRAHVGKPIHLNTLRALLASRTGSHRKDSDETRRKKSIAMAASWKRRKEKQ